MKRKIVDNYMLFIMLVVLAFVLYIGFTFAWFKPDVDGEGKNMIVETGNLSLHFQDGPEIIAKEIMPGWTDSKTFTVTNTGTLSTYYTIWWKDFENTFKNDEFVYSLTCTSYSDYDNKVEGGNCFGFDEKPVNTPEDLRILSNIAIDSGYTHEYIITVEYIETPYVQNYNQGKRFYGLINIKEYYVNEADVAELQTYSFGNKELSATIVDSYGIVAYGLSYPSASLSVDDVNWINVDNKTTFNLTTSIADYRVILWIKNKIGNVVYFNLTPHPTLIVDPNGGTWNNNIAPQTYNMTYEETKFIMEPTKEGYIFDYWTLESEGTESSLINQIFTMGEKNVRLIANYALTEYQLTIDPNGGTYNGNSNTYSSMVEYKKEINIATPERTGYTFVGWEVSSDKATLNTNIFKIGKEDCTLTANWQVNDYPWIAYHNKMNTDGNGYTLVDADTERGQANYGSKVTPTVKTYTGFNSPSAIELTISEVEANNIVNYNYERQKYNLTINPNGGSYNSNTGDTTISVYYNQSITLDTPTKTGYNFTNWTLSGGGTLTDSVFTGGLSESTLTANYSPISSIVTFNANGGGTPSFTTKTVTYNSTYGTLPTISREGYNFLGWFTSASGGVVVTSTDLVKIISSQTLYAQWSIISPVESYSCANSSVGSSPILTYTGNCEMIDDGSGNWRVKFLTSGSLTISQSLGLVDVFAVGGGGGGASASEPANWVNGGGGGGGGYTSTKKELTIAVNTSITVTIGAGGAATNSNIYSDTVTNGESGGSSSFGSYVTAKGGVGGYYNGAGGAGGSGGGGGTQYITNPGNGGSNGSDGVSSQYAGGAGQFDDTGVNTSEFGEEYDKETYIYSPGGGGATGRPGSDPSHLKGSTGVGLTGDNSGAGGTGGTAINAYVSGGGSAGSSGIVILRNSRTEDNMIIEDNKLYIGSNVFGYYSGEANVIDEGNNNWRIEFLTNGKFIYTGTSNVDIFLVGGGGGGGNGNNGPGGGGGGSGYVSTKSNITLVNNQKYVFNIGNGGAATESGEASQIMYSNSVLYSANGGYGASGTTGGNGGSGGGAGGSATNEGNSSGGAGGTNGGSGSVNAEGYYTPGTGAGVSTYMFGNESLTLLATGGAGGLGRRCKDNNGDGEYNSCSCYDNVAASGANNTGNGGTGGPCKGTGGTGGSGIIIIRNSR